MKTLKSRIGIYLVMVFVISFSTGYAEFAALDCNNHIENIQILTRTGSSDIHVRIKNVSSAPQGTAGKWFKVRYEGVHHLNLGFDLLSMLKICSNVHFYYHPIANSELAIDSNGLLKFYF